MRRSRPRSDSRRFATTTNKKSRSRALGSHPPGAAVLSDNLRVFPHIPANIILGFPDPVSTPLFGGASARCGGDGSWGNSRIARWIILGNPVKSRICPRIAPSGRSSRWGQLSTLDGRLRSACVSVLQRRLVEAPSSAKRGAPRPPVQELTPVPRPAIAHSNSLNCSTLSLAWLMMWARVERLMGRCAGTTSFSVSLAVRFCNRMWLPRCRTTIHPPRCNARITAW